MSINRQNLFIATVILGSLLAGCIITALAVFGNSGPGYEDRDLTENLHRSTHRHVATLKKLEVENTVQYTLVDDLDNWWIYDLSVPHASVSSYSLIDGSGRVALPPGVWDRSAQLPVENVLEEDEVIIEERSDVPLTGQAEEQAEEDDYPQSDAGD